LLAYPYEVMASLLKSLKPGGRVVFVEFKAEDPRVPIKPLHKMSEAQIKREATVFELEWERTVSTLPWQHVVVFGKRS
jgi:predicted methyltransferase